MGRAKRFAGVAFLVAFAVYNVFTLSKFLLMLRGIR